MKKKKLLIIAIMVTLGIGLNAQNFITIKNAPLCGQPECAEEAKLKDSLDLALASVSTRIDKSLVINISDNVIKAADKYKITEETVSFADSDSENEHKNAQMLTTSKKETAPVIPTKKTTTHRIKSKAYHIEPLNAMIFVPEKFTPNGDQINDKFYVYGADLDGFTLKIHNSQKELVFKANSIDKGWNGKFNGKVIFGAYRYTITFSVGNGSIETITGTIQSIDL